jgi:hypothetical protein
MRRLITRLADELRAEREMRRFIDRLAGELQSGKHELPVPLTAEALCDALIDVVSEIRGRKVMLLREEFPEQMASGMWLDLADQDLILVDVRAKPLHQLAILCHEMWHMINGDCGHHVTGTSVAARMLDQRAGLQDLRGTVVRAAARSEFDERAEQAAETFALKAVTHFRFWLEGEPDSRDRTRVAGRIGASLGSRRPLG